MNKTLKEHLFWLWLMIILQWLAIGFLFWGVTAVDNKVITLAKLLSLLI